MLQWLLARAKNAKIARLCKISALHCWELRTGAVYIGLTVASWPELVGSVQNFANLYSKIIQIVTTNITTNLLQKYNQTEFCLDNISDNWMISSKTFWYIFLLNKLLSTLLFDWQRSRDISLGFGAYLLISDKSHRSAPLNAEKKFANLKRQIICMRPVFAPNLTNASIFLMMNGSCIFHYTVHCETKTWRICIL